MVFGVIHAEIDRVEQMHTHTYIDLIHYNLLLSDLYMRNTSTQRNLPTRKILCFKGYFRYPTGTLPRLSHSSLQLIARLHRCRKSYSEQLERPGVTAVEMTARAPKPKMDSPWRMTPPKPAC